MADSLSIEARFTRVHAAIITASEQAGRAHNEVTLLAVSKKQSVVSIRELYAAGQVDFGENYVQEAVTKIEALRDLDIRWHYIGQIQRNKTRTIAEHFAWVQSVDRLLIAKRLSDERPDSLPPLNLCLQVNMQGEAQKAGVAPEEVARWLQEDVLQFTDIQRDSLKRQLYRYKAALPAHELLKATEEPLWIKTAIDKMRRGINELEELEKMYLLQQRRINIDAQTEDKINKLFKGTNKEIELATTLLEKMIKLKIELGILDSQPSRIQFDGIMGTVPVELDREGATESETDSMRLRLGLLSAKLVKAMSDFNPEKESDKENITH